MNTLPEERERVLAVKHRATVARCVLKINIKIDIYAGMLFPVTFTEIKYISYIHILRSKTKNLNSHEIRCNKTVLFQ